MKKSLEIYTSELNIIINKYQKAEHISINYIILILVELVAMRVRENLFKN